MYSIIYSYTAKKNLSEIQSYIAKDDLVVSIKVLVEIKNTINFLKDFPSLGTKITGNLRKLVDSKYNFTIIYRIKNNKIIEIVTIFKYKNFNY